MVNPLVKRIGALILGFSIVALTLTNPAIAREGRADAIADWGACMNATKQGDLVVLLDQSGSLSRTDPNHDRVTAASYLIERLNKFSQDSGVTLNVQVAGFADTYRPVGSWTELNSDSIPQIEDSIANISNDLRSHDTDYWIALDEARRSLADRSAAEGTDNTCRAIAWFTDGEFAIDARTNPTEIKQYGEAKPYAPELKLTDQDTADAVLEFAREDTCRSGGIADQVRSSDITLIGVGLTVDDPDFDFIRSVTLGGGANANSNGVNSCGEVDSPTGVFLEASDVESLFEAFDKMTSPGQTQKRVESGVCQGSVCDERAGFVLDNSLSEIDVMARLPVEGIELHVFAPNEEDAIVLKPGPADTVQNEAGIAYQWRTDKLLTFNLSRDEFKSWDGEWEIAFVDPASQSADANAVANLHLTSLIALRWENLADIDLHQDEQLEAPLQAYNTKTGNPINLADLKGKAQIEVSVTDSAGNEHTLFTSSDKTALNAGTLPIDLSGVAIGAAELSQSIVIQTADFTRDDGTVARGTRLEPRVSTAKISINPPLNFPTVHDRVLVFADTETETTEGTVHVSGPGCIWLDSSTVTLSGVPSDAEPVTFASPHQAPDNCLELKQDSTSELPITLTVAKVANGAINGQLQLMLTPEKDSDVVQPVAVEFRANMAKPLNATQFGIAFFGLLLLGIGLPVFLLYVMKARASRIPAGQVFIAAKRVSIRDVTNGAIQFSTSDFTGHGHSKSRRRISHSNYTFTAKMGWSPTATGRVVLDSGYPSISGAQPGSEGSPARARLPLGIAGNWVAVLDQTDSPDFITLILLIGSIAAQEQRRVLADARDNLGDRVSEISNQVDDSDELDRSDDAHASPSNSLNSQTRNESPFPNPSGSPWGHSPDSPFPDDSRPGGQSPWS